MFQLVISGIAIVFLILNNSAAISGANEGISLCLKTVIPSLLPMMVLSVMFTGNAAGRSSRLIAWLCKPLGIPQGLESIMITGLIGGYPTGAKCIIQAINDKRITDQDARRMLIFCNNAGPAFIFGIAYHLFPSKQDLWLLWLIHILSAISTAMVLPKNKRTQKEVMKQSNCSISEAVTSSAKTMATICVWIILFKVLLTIINPIISKAPEIARCFIAGIMELTNGITSLTLIESMSTRFILASFTLSFGGLCIILQTKSIAKDIFSGYIPGKILQSLFSILYAAIWNGLYRREMYFFIIIPTVMIISAIIYITNSKTPIDFVENLNYNKKKIRREVLLCFSERKFNVPVPIAVIPPKSTKSRFSVPKKE